MANKSRFLSSRGPRFLIKICCKKAIFSGYPKSHRSDIYIRQSPNCDPIVLRIGKISRRCIPLTHLPIDRRISSSYRAERVSKGPWKNCRIINDHRRPLLTTYATAATGANPRRHMRGKSRAPLEGCVTSVLTLPVLMHTHYTIRQRYGRCLHTVHPSAIRSPTLSS